MNLFGNDKIMDHGRSSEAGSQTDCLHAGSCCDDFQQPRPVPVQRSCPGSLDDMERMYVLRNCDRGQDYTVTSCHKCQCPSRNTQCSGQCASPPQESLYQQGKKSKPPKDSPSQESSPRRVGGKSSTNICQICGMEQLHDPGQNMCPNCNERIYSAVENYYVQCQGQCQPNGQPCPNLQSNEGHWQQLNGLPGDQPFNIIVLQDPQNQQQIIDQLSTAMSRGGGQMHIPQPPGHNEYPNNYSNNQLSGYIDYEYVDFNRGYEQAMYDYGYDMDQGPGSGSGGFSSGHSYEDDRYRSVSSCNSYDCPKVNPDYQRSRQSNPDYQKSRHSNPDYQKSRQSNPDYQKSRHDQDEERQDQGQGCTCNCEFCRKGFETKEKLAMLIAQALEIFILGRQQSKQRNSEPNPKPKKKNKKKKRRTAGETESKAQVWTTVEANQAKPKVRSPEEGKPAEKPVPRPKCQLEKPTTNSKTTTAKTNTQTNFNRFACRKQESCEDSSQCTLPRTPNQQCDVDSSQSGSNNSEPPPFFLPNWGDQRCRSSCGGLCSRGKHDCAKGCLPHCRGPCSRSGGGDGTRRRSKNRRRDRNPNQGGGFQWQDTSYGSSPSGTAKGCAGQPRTPAGGGKSTSALLGLSPIAHYRPGMMQFPVNYLLAGTNFRRRLVRTAAGVTLHQKPYVYKAEAKDLPSFPCRKESNILECRTPPPTKRWI